MSPTTLVVSIGLPTRNGARFLAESLTSLCAQDYPHLEIVVSDNASDDGTAEIVQGWPDPRVRYVRQPEPVGAMENFARALRATSAPYFMWAADHDLWSPNYVSASLRWLSEYPGRVLAYPETTLIDVAGQPLEEMPATPADLCEPSALARYRRLVWEFHNGNMIYGLIRRSALERTSVGLPVIGGDMLILAELALQGPFQQAYGARFYRRDTRPDETDDEQMERRVRDLRAEGGYRALRDAHLAAVSRSGLGWLDKRRAERQTRKVFAARFAA